MKNKKTLIIGCSVGALVLIVGLIIYLNSTAHLRNALQGCKWKPVEVDGEKIKKGDRDSYTRMEFFESGSGINYLQDGKEKIDSFSFTWEVTDDKDLVISYGSNSAVLTWDKDIDESTWHISGGNLYIGTAKYKKE